MADCERLVEITHCGDCRHRKWFVDCVHDLHAGATRVGPFDTKGDADAAIPAIEAKGMGGRSWDEVIAVELECVNVNGRWFTLEPVVDV